MAGKEPFETVVAAHGGTVLRVCRAVLGLAAVSYTHLTLPTICSV